MNAALQILFAYLLGSLLGSLLVGRMRGGIDIRRLGSGNPGSTNALRTQGAGFALAVVLFDAGKGLVAAALLPRLALAASPTPVQLQAWIPACCAAAALLGHLLPLWHGFRGGKGVATVGGSLLALSPPLFACAAASWLTVLLARRVVSLASIVTALLLPVAAAILLLFAVTSQAVLLYATGAGLLVLVTHRDNVVRLRAGTEPRLSRRR